MLDLKLIRSDPERVKAALARRGAAEQVDELLGLDARRRELLPQIEGAQAERKTISKQIGEAKQRGEDGAEQMAAVAELKQTIESGKAELEQVDADLQLLAAALPNLPDPDAPEGMTEEDAVVLREEGALPSFDFEPRDHLEIGTELGLIDMEAGARVSGSRFAYVKGDLVLLELALVRFALDLVRGEGHEPVVPPVLVRRGPGRDRLPARRPRPDLRGAQGRAVPRRHLRGAACRPARRRDPRRRAAADSLRRLLTLLPSRGRRRRPRHPRHLPRPPVRQGRDVLVRRALRVGGRARAPAGDRGAHPLRAGDSLPRRQRRRRRPRRPRGQEVRLRGVDPEPGPLPRADLVLKHNRLPGAALGL